MRGLATVRWPSHSAHAALDRSMGNLAESVFRIASAGALVASSRRNPPGPVLWLHSAHVGWSVSPPTGAEHEPTDARAEHDRSAADGLSRLRRGF